MRGSTGSSGEFLQHGFVDPNSSIKVFQGKILVRRVCATVRKSESKQQRFRTKNVTEIRHDRNAAALTNQHRIPFESFLERALSGLTILRMRVGQIPGTGMPRGHVEFHPGRAIFLQMFLRQRYDLVAVLVRNKTESELRHRLTSNHRLGPLSLITAAKSIDLRRRSRPNSLQR